MKLPQRTFLLLLVVLGACLLPLLIHKRSAPIVEIAARHALAKDGSASQAHGEPGLVSTGAVNPTHSAPSGRADSAMQWSILASLLDRPHERPKVAEVPLLTTENEARLIELYRSIRSPWDKQHIIRMLAFGGGSASAQVLKDALTREYDGESVTFPDANILAYVPVLCGVLARRNDDALEFLVEGSSPGFWLNTGLWDSEYRTTAKRTAILTGRCIEGLCVSERSEGGDVLQFYREHPEEAVLVLADGEIGSFEGEVVGAAFKKAVLSEVGFEQMMDQILYDSDIAMRRFSEWSQLTPDGRSWDVWYHRLLAVKHKLRTEIRERTVDAMRKETEG